jgi:nucleoside-diphosphate-sugar epimerase
MKLLITGAASALGGHLIAGLREAHVLRLTDRNTMQTDLEFVRCPLDHGEITDQVVADSDVLIHLAHVARDGEPANQWLDLNTRCTYNLLLAASRAHIKRVIYLSVLDMFCAYETDLAVAEDWRPRPTCEPRELGPYMGEFVVREFAPTGALDVLILRIGHVITAVEAETTPFDPMWVDARDVSGAVAAALRQPSARFAISHLQHRSRRARFRMGRSRHGIDYTPQHSFEEQP